MFGWLRENRPQAAQVAAGWSGVMSLPRVLTLLPGGDLGMAPAPEVASLRGRRQAYANLAVEPGQSSLLPALRGDQLEIAAELLPGGAEAFGFRLRRSPDGSEETLVTTTSITAVSASTRSAQSTLMSPERIQSSTGTTCASAWPPR